MKKPALRVKEVEILMLTKHLSIMIKAGIPILESLSTLQEQAKTKAARMVLAGVAESVRGGAKLSEGLAQYPKVFDNLYVSVVQIAEESGTLEESLAYLVTQRTKSYQLKKKVQSAMMYPALVLSVTGLIGGAIAFFVLPQLVEFFSLLDVELPLSTRILIGAGEIMRDWGWLIGIVLVGIVMGFLALMRGRKFRKRVQKMILKFPIVGVIVQEANVATVARNLGVMVKNGVPLMQALTATANTLTSLPLKDELIKVGEKVKGGGEMGGNLLKYAPSYPTLMARMVQVGEKTGKLDESLIYLAEFFEEEVEEKAKNLSTVLEPIMLVTIGLVVAGVAMAVISPIYELTGNIR